MGFIIWMIGWFVSYAMMTRVVFNNPTAYKEWDNVGRVFCMVICIIFSWVVALICLVVLVFPKWIVPFLKKLEPKGLRHE